MNLKKTWKKLFSGILSLFVLASTLPVTAFATYDNTAQVYAMFKQESITGDSMSKNNHFVGTVTPSARSVHWKSTSEPINLWIYSDAMNEEEKKNGGVVPYIQSGSQATSDGTYWYLKEIVWANAQNVNEENLDTVEKFTLLGSSAIKSADSIDDYTVDLSDFSISGDPFDRNGEKYYSIFYIWTKTDPDNWVDTGSETKSYTVKYDLNVEEIVGGAARYLPVQDQSPYISFQDIGITPPGGNPVSEVTEGQHFSVGNSEYTGYLAVSNNDEYYKFAGWLGEDSKTYKNPDDAIASDAMAGSDNEITLTAQWEKIVPLSAEELKEAANELPLDLFERPSNIAQGENGILFQWTDADETVSLKTTTLDEEKTLSYTISATLYTALTAVKGGEYNDDYITLTFHMNVDDALTFASENPTITVSAGPMVLRETNLGEIDKDAQTINVSDTADLSNIEIKLGWSSEFTGDFDGNITISGLDFKLKNEVTDPENFKVNSTANITGTMDLSQRTDLIRFHYEAANALLIRNYFDESDDGVVTHKQAWYDYFKAEEDYVTAFVHALQYMDYRLKDGGGIDLSDSSKPDMIKANTVTATYTQYTITATAGANGSITPNGATKVYKGDSQTFIITPNSGYHIEDVLVDGASVGAVSTYTFENVTANHTISATFERNSSGGGGGTTSYTIKASAGDGGSISPSGNVRVDRGDDQTFRITAENGYVIADVLVDGESVGAVSSYTFENVRSSHTIEVIFEEDGSVVADPDDTGVSDWLNTEDHNAYLSGYPGSLFGPDNNMTRAEVAQMFYNLLLDKNVAITVTFSDVPADAWYADAVNTLASLGMITGVGNNQFEPDRSITRAEFTTIAMRFTNGTMDGENIFPDVNPDDWFYDYVVGSIQYGWITGYPDGTFGPGNPITRAEVTTIVNRMLGRSADEAFVDSHQTSLVQFGDITDRHWAYYQVMEATNAHDYTKDNGVEDWTRLN